MFEKLIDGYCKLIGYLIAAMLATMVALVFGNVFMRYAFNSGFTLSEELSRWLFVWMTFLGAVVALRSNAHLGTDMLAGSLWLTWWWLVRKEVVAPPPRKSAAEVLVALKDAVPATRHGACALVLLNTHVSQVVPMRC